MAHSESPGAVFTRNQVAERNSRTDAVFIIDNVVYNVTEFLDEHPGGHEVLLNVAGRDASEDFEDVGHSLDAKELMRKYRVGEVAAGERREVRRRQVRWDDGAGDSQPGFMGSWKFPVLLGLLVTVVYSYLFA